MTSELQIKFSSWNCRALQKIKKLKREVKKYSFPNHFFSRTHLSLDEDIWMRRRWQSKVLSAPFNTQARGVMTRVEYCSHLNWCRYLELSTGTNCTFFRYFTLSVITKNVVSVVRNKSKLLNFNISLFILKILHATQNKTPLYLPIPSQNHS